VVYRLGWVSLLTDAASDMIYPLLPAFLLEIGGGGVALGVMEGVAEGVGALVKWLAGFASDGRARKPFVVVGYGIATFVRPLIGLASAPWHVVVARSVDRVGKGLRSAPRDGIVAASVAPERRAAAFGFHRAMDNAGAVIGPLLAFALARFAHLGTRTIFFAALLPGLLALATLILGVREPEAGSESRSGPRSGSKTRGPVRTYLAIVALFTLGASADSFLLLRLKDLGLSVAWLPIAWLTLNASKSVTNVPGGKLSDRLGHRRTLVLAWLLYAAAYAIFPLTGSIALTWGLVVVYGAYYGLSEGGERAIVAELAPADERGRAFGALHAITGAVVLPANVLFGALYSADRVAWAFGLSAACAAVAAVALGLSGVVRDPGR
jgi:MFS family permease